MSSKRIPALAVWATVTLGLSACARFEHHGPHYRDAQQRAALVVPPDLSTPVNEERLPAPPTGSGGVAPAAPSAQVTTAGTTTVLPASTVVQLVRAGGQRWLRVEAAPASVWPLVQAFFRGRGFQILKPNPAAGMFVTNWASHPAQLASGKAEHGVGRLFSNLFEAGRQQRYRVRLEADTRGGATEVYITQEAVRAVVVPDAVTGGATHVWQLDPPSPARDADSLSALMAYLNQQHLPSIQATQPVPSGGRGAGLALPAGAGTSPSPAPSVGPLTTPPTHPGAGPGTGSPLSSAHPSGHSPERAGSNQWALASPEDAWGRLGVALAEAGAVVQQAQRTSQTYRVRFAEGPTTAGRISELMAQRRARARRYRVVLAANVVTVEPADTASPLVTAVRGQLR